MNKTRTLIATLLAFFLLSVPAFAQTALTTTTLTNAITSQTATTLVLGSNTGATANSTALYIDGEYMAITGTTSTTTVTVRRGQGGTAANLHPANSYVWIGVPRAFTTVDQSGSCTATSTLYSPVINIANGRLWTCTSSLWQSWQSPPIAHTHPRISVSGLTVSGGGQLPYNILPTDDIVVLNTTSAGCLCVAGSSAVNKTFILPSHLGLAGKQITLMDESGGISATTSIVLVGTINGTQSGGSGSSVNVIQLKTAFSSVILHAGSGGWFVDSCFQPQATGVVVSGQCR